MQAELLHLLDVAMAAGAGVGDVLSVNGGFQILGWDDVVCIAMAILAGSGLVAPLAQCLSMGTLQIDFRFQVVALGAIHFLQRGVVLGLINIAVTAGALIIGMNRSLKKVSVYKRLRILLAMAFQAGGVFYFCGCCRLKRQPKY